MTTEIAAVCCGCPPLNCPTQVAELVYCFGARPAAMQVNLQFRSTTTGLSYCATIGSGGNLICQPTAPYMVDVQLSVTGSLPWVDTPQCRYEGNLEVSLRYNEWRAWRTCTNQSFYSIEGRADLLIPVRLRLILNAQFPTLNSYELIAPMAFGQYAYIKSNVFPCIQGCPAPINITFAQGLGRCLAAPTSNGSLSVTPNPNTGIPCNPYCGTFPTINIPMRSGTTTTQCSSTDSVRSLSIIPTVAA